MFHKATGLDLYGLDKDKTEDLSKVQKALMTRNDEAMQLLLDFAISTELKHVELYENQVCSHGQNVASMGQSFVAYSASMENLNMAPVGCVAKPEKGTNGQTIDRLIQQKTDVRLVDDQVDSLFKMMKSHPQGKLLHALIDVGAYFRGQDNEVAAKMICDYLREIQSPIQGVLFFDGATDQLCFMQKDPPYTVKRLTGTTPEIIAEETGFSNSELFTYYDQDHMTGVDIHQDELAHAIVTMKKGTKIHEVLQGTRRMRQLDFMQRIIIALPKSSLPSIGETLQKQFKEGEAPSIKELLLYAHINEAEDRSRKTGSLLCKR